MNNLHFFPTECEKTQLKADSDTESGEGKKTATVILAMAVIRPINNNGETKASGEGK